MSMPSIIVGGVEKCGTTWFYKQLARSNDFWVPPVKEINYFNSVESDGGENRNFGMPLDWYKNFFSGAPAKKIICEVSPLYYSDTNALLKISEINSDAKVLILLRDPVRRAWSHFWMACRKDNASVHDPIRAFRSNYSGIRSRGDYGSSFDVASSLFINKLLFVNIESLSCEYCSIFVSKRLSDFLGGEVIFDLLKKENEAYRPRSKFLLNLYSSTVKFLHRNGFSPLIQHLKKRHLPNGASGFLKMEEKYPKMDADFYNQAKKYYEENYLKFISDLKRKDLFHGCDKCSSIRNLL